MIQTAPLGTWYDLDSAPVYNIKAVAEATGLPAATLRAWERRYGTLNPGRTANGYRLYSAQDVALQIGDCWHRGAITTTSEHFASNYLRRNLYRGPSSAKPRVLPSRTSRLSWATHVLPGNVVSETQS